MANRLGKNGNKYKLYFLGLQNHCRWWLRPWNLLLPGRKAMTNLDILKSRDSHFAYKVHIVKAMVFPGVMYVYASRTMKKAECQRIDALELWCRRRVLRVLWTARRSSQSWIFTGRTEVEAETPILWPPDVKNWLIGKDPDAGKDWRQEEKGVTEDEMVRWHHWLKGHEFE